MPENEHARSPRAPRAEEAMNRALLAEREAQEAVAACEAEAERVLETARLRAVGIIERADRAIARLHRSCADRLQRQMEMLAQRSVEPGGGSNEEVAGEVLRKAAAKLAERLTGPEKEPDRP